MEKGITRELSRFAVPINLGLIPKPIPIMIEGSYGSHGSGSFLNEYVNESNRYNKIICISGGVGITALLPKLLTLRDSPHKSKSTKIKLYWSSRSQSLVDSVQELFPTTVFSDPEKSCWDGIETHISVGTRLHLEEIIDTELTKSDDHTGTLVVVSGPKGMADSVRNLVTTRAKRGIVVKFIQESFEW
ncbi:uncharacterized protein L201_001166 [Kwoniella dendrophila CBS 6074]|uniref:Ferric reductase NAD binding domain-containing protein n=1 Tax=Kwoniella dendrophila CBS 6074 TaxID=1295534 RepID=A0AAX4JPB7_9TREE